LRPILIPNLGVAA